MARRSARDERIHGILNLHKPSGPTSHDCVSRCRRTFGTRRVGHAGTLDPLASGVLIVGIGNGTRILELLQAQPKRYRAELRLGLETDTQDITGQTLSEGDASHVDEASLIHELEGFLGEQLQLPPMYSALKHEGRPLYELAREGEEVEREPRLIRIDHIACTRFTPGPRATAELLLTCTSGTYVRTLCHDLGRRLGCGGTMAALVREAIGSFELAGAVPLDELSADTPLFPLAEAIPWLPAFRVTDDEFQALFMGQRVPAGEGESAPVVRILNRCGKLVALGASHRVDGKTLLSPKKVFASLNGHSD